MADPQEQRGFCTMDSMILKRVQSMLQPNQPHPTVLWWKDVNDRAACVPLLPHYFGIHLRWHSTLKGDLLSGSIMGAGGEGEEGEGAQISPK